MKNKIILTSAIVLSTTMLNASDIRPLIGVEVGSESGSFDDEFSSPGYMPESYEHDYSGVNFRLSGGIAIEHETLESRLKVYYEAASGEVEFDNAFNAADTDIDSTEIGLNYELVFSQKGLQPLIGVEVGSGSSKFDVPGATDMDYTSFGLYGGLLYPITDNIDFTARLGYKARSYDDYSVYVSGIGIVTEETDYSGVDLKVGLTYLF